MIRIKVILLLFFCTFINAQQVDDFITKAIKSHPSKVIDSLARVTSVTSFEAAKNYYILGKCHAYLNQEEIAFNYFIEAKKSFEILGEIHYEKQIALEAHKTIASQEHFEHYGNTLFKEYQKYADSVNISLYKAYAIKELAVNAYYEFDIENATNFKVLDSACTILKTAISYANKTNNDLVKVKLYSNMSVFKNTMQQYDSARYYLDKSKVHIDKIDDAYELYGYYHNYANSYLSEGNYEKAVTYFLEAKTKVPYYKDKAVRRIYQQLAASYDSLNNNVERRKYEKLFREFDDKIKDREQNVRMHESLVKYDVEEKDEEISSLRIVVVNLKEYWIWYSVVLFLVFLLALYSFIRWKKVDRKRKKIKQEKEGIEAEHEKTIKQLEKVKQLVVEEHIILKNKVKMPLAELMYIKSEDHYLNFVPHEGKNQFLRGKISEILEELPPNFVKCHRSYIVNKNYIKSNTYKSITLQTGEEIPVSRSFKL
ncbi:MAG: hypothetical protein BM557_00905 [Flavobacterium sp. MedPE-SWcel]|uniref:LytTR family transcriptional regulator n=1 Tax=uncultured Flavobacterium sp. TaxID=165435 RepID=UPI00091D41F5|nr:LytTR family transcriptional regulator [uncultured Flavobacterium sp.]OIQ22578.1 MAG: hypothetical protein BM557_00905 [Flavobacterium sp. MedPE-SWcel]